MKKLIVLSILGVLIISGLGAATTLNNKTINEKIKEESISISEPIIEDAGQYVTIGLKEATSTLSEPGKPIIPVVTKVFTFPFETKISSVDLSFSETKELILSKEIKPAPEPVEVGMQAISEPTKNSATYESTDLYPSSDYSYITASGLNENKHVAYLVLQWYPVRYSPIQNRIYYSENADIKITYKEPANPMTFNDVYDMVIIAPSEYSAKLQPLVTHKNSCGIRTIIKTTEDIYSEYHGRDKAEQIKYFIKDAIESWGIKYVLLVGSIDKLPIRTTYPTGWGDVLTDLYYADIYDGTGGFCSWDKNGNDRFGEAGYNGNIDGVDRYPDVNVGRLACADANEVSNVVDKIINYETSTYGKSWFNNIILVGGDTFPNGQNYYEGEVLNNIIEQIMSDFVPIKLWASTNTFSASKLNKAINNGAGFMSYSGHGIADGIVTHPPNSENWIRYYSSNLIGLFNSNKLPIIFFDACLTAKLDHSEADISVPISKPTSRVLNSFSINYIFKSVSRILKLFLDDHSSKSASVLDSNVVLSEPETTSKLIPCFAWNCVEKSNGGAIATVGATRVSFWGISDGAGKLSIEFFSAYKNGETLGKMMTQAQNGFITDVPWDFFAIEEFVLIGDPSLEIGGYP